MTSIFDTMKKKPFVSKLDALAEEASQYLRRVIDRRGNYYELAAIMDIDDDTDLQELADSGEVLCVDIVDENDGNPYEYVALEIRIDDEGDLMLVARSVSVGEEIVTPPGSLSAEDLCRLADWAVNLENPE